jgi:A/G-specific adenine glycosylase
MPSNHNREGLTPIWEPPIQEIEAVRSEVLSFFSENGRDLPWRRTRDPYRILVSEVMLQQTQVSRVLPYFDRFLARFPNEAALARADAGDVLRVWQGLGYNRRAVYLKRAANCVITTYDGEFPRQIQDIESLPGVGKYTARAVACFAFNIQVAIVETNVRKAITLFARRFEWPFHRSTIDRLALVLMPPGRAWEWNQAMIDYGALVVRPDTLRRTNSVATIPFEETDRFWRGRIMAALCAAPSPLTVTRLLRELPQGGDEYRVRCLIWDLDVEGLVRHDSEDDAVRLP